MYFLAQELHDEGQSKVDPKIKRINIVTGVLIIT